MTSATDIGIVIYFSGAVLWQVQDILANPKLMLDLVDSCNGHAGGFKDASGNFSFYRAHSQLLEGKVATMGSAGMNYLSVGIRLRIAVLLDGIVGRNKRRD